MTQSTASANLGFLTVLHDAGGYQGGYLVTNTWGRPLEFRLSSAVQPNRVQQVLYGDTLAAYVCTDLIGKTLVDKTATPVQLLLTDTEAALDLRQRLELPVVWVKHDTAAKPNMIHHDDYPQDTAAAQTLLEHLDGSLQVTEPFARIREALAEARRMGLTGKN